MNAALNRSDGQSNLGPFFSILPIEVLEMCLPSLDASSISAISSTCRGWRRLHFELVKSFTAPRNMHFHRTDGNCHPWNDRKIIHQIVHYPRVRHIDLRGCAQFSSLANMLMDHRTWAASYLETLHLEGTLTSDADISAISHLCLRVKSLYFDSNPISYVAPLVHCSCLTHLSIANTSITDIADLCESSSLESINLKGSSVTNESVIELLCSKVGNRLTRLNASFLNAFSEIEPLSMCVCLRYLNLNRTLVKGLEPLSNCIRLETLKLRATPVQDIVPLRNCTRLKKLTLAQSRVSDISALAACVLLTNLDIQGTRVASIAALKSCRALRILDLGNSEVNDVNCLACCPQLESISLQNADVNDVSCLSGLKGLRKLDLRGTQVTDMTRLLPCTNLLEGEGELLESQAVDVGALLAATITSVLFVCVYILSADFDYHEG